MLASAMEGVDFLALFHSALKGFREKEENFSSPKPFPTANENNNIVSRVSERAWYIGSAHTGCLG